MQTPRKPKNVETIPIATRITKQIQGAIQKVLTTNAHINTSDYLRDLVRKDLAKRGLLDE